MFPRSDGFRLWSPKRGVLNCSPAEVVAGKSGKSFVVPSGLKSGARRAAEKEPCDCALLKSVPLSKAVLSAMPGWGKPWACEVFMNWLVSLVSKAPKSLVN